MTTLENGRARVKIQSRDTEAATDGAFETGADNPPTKPSMSSRVLAASWAIVSAIL
jgi:hypothetical protein